MYVDDVEIKADVGNFGVRVGGVVKLLLITGLEEDSVST